MLYDGIRFRRNRTIVTLPYTEDPNVRFGRIVPEGTKGAVETDWRIKSPNGQEKVVWAKEIPVLGHSLTNMARTKKQYLLAYDGQIFTAPIHPTHFGHRYNRRTGEYLT